MQIFKTLSNRGAVSGLVAATAVIAIWLSLRTRAQDIAPSPSPPEVGLTAVPGAAPALRPASEGGLTPVPGGPTGAASEVGQASVPGDAPLPNTAINDPEKAVDAFVAQNQKLAEIELASLKDEESKLRARLEKVQTGIKRWQAVVDALKASQDAPSPHPGNAENTLDTIPRSKVEPLELKIPATEPGLPPPNDLLKPPAPESVKPSLPPGKS